MTARGLKRICAECGTRFYDFNKSPIICPNCGAEFTGLTKVKSRKPRAVANEKNPETETEKDDKNKTVKGEIEADEDTISLDDLADSEDGDDGDDDDIDLDNLDDLDDVDNDDDMDDLEDDLGVGVDSDDDR